MGSLAGLFWSNVWTFIGFGFVRPIPGGDGLDVSVNPFVSIWALICSSSGFMILWDSSLWRGISLGIYIRSSEVSEVSELPDRLV